MSVNCKFWRFSIKIDSSSGAKPFVHRLKVRGENFPIVSVQNMNGSAKATERVGQTPEPEDANDFTDIAG